MIETMEKNYCDYLQQCNITDTDDNLRPKSGQKFHSKFIRSLDNQKACQENLKQKIHDIKKMDSFQEQNCEKFQREYLSVNTVTQASTYSGKSNVSSQKEYNYKGHVIKGRLRRRQLNGDTSIVYSNGKQFQGLYENGRMKEGRFDFKNGYEYSGELDGKQFNGKGTLKCPDGKKITGLWRGQRLVGKAQIQYPQGDIYYGQVDNFMKHGDGCLMFKSGSKYVGNFERGQINGYGTYYQVDGKYVKGIWRDGELVREDQYGVQSLEDIQLNVSEIKSLF